MNRRTYEKRKRQYEIFNKKIYRFAQSKWQKERVDVINRYKNMFNDKAFEHYAEDLKWPVHLNYARIISWHKYKQNNMTPSKFLLSIEKLANSILK